MRILFLHGWHLVPGGVKPTYLKDRGHEVNNQPLMSMISPPLWRLLKASFTSINLKSSWNLPVVGRRGESQR